MKKNLIFALVCATVMLTGCDKIDKLTSRDFTVRNIAFDFTAVTDDAPVAVTSGSTETTLRSGTMSSFTVTRTVDISEMGSSEIIEYANKISKVQIDGTTVNVSAVPPGSYTVTTLTITAAGVPGSLVIPSYTLGDAFTPPAGMDAYTTAFIMRLLSAKQVSVTVAGQSDAPPGTTLNISYKSDIIFTASLL